ALEVVTKTQADVAAAAEAHPEDWAAAEQKLNEFEAHVASLERVIKSDLEKPAFDRKFKEGIKLIDLVCSFPAANDKAVSALKDMEYAFDHAIDSAGDGDHLPALKFLQQAIDQAKIASDQRVEARDAFFSRKKQVDGEFAAVKKRITDPVS